MQFLTRGFAVLIVIALVAMPVLAASDGVKQINAKNVCFMNLKRFDRTLKSVEVNGKRYYGCCSDCLAQLKDNAERRMAVDPVSGAKIDKADAVIGMDKNGNIYFFENTNNLHKFRVPATAVPTGE